ncbi:SirB2 family protein [Chitinimonas lacunae]|uniref:SirB2 family protein n=1 Tax=Chitinimonas lacunae TaxID=1963018 RepID=A0ABV8MP60_9NEIS
MSYYLIKHIHMTTVGITALLFVLRGVWMLTDSPRLQARWVRIVPHINDTVLLGSAIVLASMLRQAPFLDGWLTAKLLGLLAYIALGTVALKRGRTRTIRATAFFLALLVLGYIVLVARSKQPWPFG